MLYILYYIAYLLTGSVQQSPWKTNQFSASQEIPPFYGNHSFITTFTSACHLTLSWAHTIGLIQVWGTRLFFITCYIFTVRGCSHLTQPLSWSTTPCRLSDSLFYIFAATLHFGGHSSICNQRTCHVVTGTHLSWPYCILWWIYYNKLFRKCIVSMYNKHYCLLSSWYVSFLGSSGNVTYHISHLPLQILCFKIIKIFCRVKKICIFLVSKCVAYICMFKRQSILNPLPANVENMVSS